MENADVTLRGLSVGYGSRTLIENANSHFGAGELIGLIGRNGAGKSTLLRALAGVDRPLSGEVLYGQRNIARMPAHERAKAVAFVSSRRVRIPAMRCRDVVGLGRAPYTDWIGRLSAADWQIVDEALSLVGMAEYAQRPLDSLSDGECQRVMIARALAQDTPVVLLDEPTSFLDLPSRRALCRLLAGLAHGQQGADSRENSADAPCVEAQKSQPQGKGKCIIFSTHELDLALEHCTRIALINPPELIVAPPAQLEASGIIDRLFKSW